MSRKPPNKPDQPTSLRSAAVLERSQKNMHFDMDAF
jgi:hypothetical protein